jgi:hypothetical protein
MASDYLNFGGWTTLPRPPFNCLGADFYGFSFPADRAACQQYLDKSYNAIAGRQKYRVLLDLVFLLYVKNTAIVAQTPPFSNEGGIPETDAGFWLLVGSYDELAIFPSAIAWVPAYLFVDCALAVSVGREIMGYPKYFSNMTSPDNAPSAGPFTASAMLTRTFAPHAIASQHEFLSLQGSNFAAEPLESSAAIADFHLETFVKLAAVANEDLLRPFIEGAHGSEFLFHPNIPVPVWYLRQFRSADGSDAAVYQALVEGPLTLTTVRQACLLPGVGTLELGVFDSLPFVTELGLGEPKDGKVTLTTNLGFYANCDYISGIATPIA